MSAFYTVTVEYDPTNAVLLGRWAARIEGGDERRVGGCYGCFTRKSAERSARRFIRRLPGRRAYTVVIARVEVTP